MPSLTTTEKVLSAKVKGVVDQAADWGEISQSDYDWVILHGSKTQKDRLDAKITALHVALVE